MAENSRNQNSMFKIQVHYEQQPQVEINLIGFLFNCRGRLLQKQYVKNNELEFNLQKTHESRKIRRYASINDLRLFIAPATDKRIMKVTNLEEISSYKAYEPILVTGIENEVSIMPIPDIFSRYWIYCKCRVTGKVSKWFNGGNVWEDKPVCRARVHICEIDSINYWINRIPDHIIAKIPDAILRPEKIKRIPIPIPDPPPFERPVILPQQPIENLFDTISTEEEHLKIMSNLPDLGENVKRNLATGNLNTIRETIVSNYTLFHPWFCLWPRWWRYFYRCKELAVVKTNAHGRFDASITYNCFGDKPDIYIWVEYFINGEWTTVYKPYIPCNTHWNYACGTDINIHITDPRVPGDCCCDCHVGGEWVSIRTVSNKTSVHHINQISYLQPPPSQSVPYDRIGLTDASAHGDSLISTSVGDYKRPFGGVPSFYMGFGSDLPNNGIYYYRWSYRQVSDAELIAVGDSFKPLIPTGGEVRKGYEFEYQDLNGDTQTAPNSVKLGPFSIEGVNDNLYKIPPQHPEEAPFFVEESNPIWDEPTYNMNTIRFDSNTFEGGDGLYEFKLELFDQEGNLISDIQRSTFKVLKYDNATLSENAPDSLLADPTGDKETGGTADAFNILMRFDNASCEANIYTVNIDGDPAALDCCGFVKYKPDGAEVPLEITFKATHPNNFAVFNFGVVKGTCGGVPIANANGMVIDDASGYTLGTILNPVPIGIYSKHFTPEQLLAECYNSGEGKAAFGQSLRVHTMATNGHSRVSSYNGITRDAGRNTAFALEP